MLSNQTYLFTDTSLLTQVIIILEGLEITVKRPLIECYHLLLGVA